MWQVWYVANVLIEFLQIYKIMNEDKCGYQESKGTSQLLQNFASALNEKLDKRIHIFCMLVNFFKAFDLIDHGILINQLEIYGIR